ncbi:MAG: phosphohydrolase, partial [Oscillospiraceae bacterium]|nr:phosphohydrolase [Oscillospiraceae bacterium]
LADKLSNMRSIYRMWMEQGDAAWEIFHEKDPEKQAWYYRSVVALLSELKGYEAWQELNKLVETIFEGVS